MVTSKTIIINVSSIIWFSGLTSGFFSNQCQMRGTCFAQRVGEFFSMGLIICVAATDNGNFGTGSDKSRCDFLGLRAAIAGNRVQATGGVDVSSKISPWREAGPIAKASEKDSWFAGLGGAPQCFKRGGQTIYAQARYTP